MNGSEAYSHPEVIGHVPELIALWLIKFLKRPSVVKRKCVNRGGVHGREIPCRYTLEGAIFSQIAEEQFSQREKFEVKDSTTEHYTNNE